MHKILKIVALLPMFAALYQGIMYLAGVRMIFHPYESWFSPHDTAQNGWWFCITAVLLLGFVGEAFYRLYRR